MSGTLYVVSTPIGNREDLTPRARTVLSQVSCVLCEDTRRAGVLMKEIGVKAQLLSYFDHNEKERVPAIIARLKAGQDFALISDAGTPTISDPGYRIIKSSSDEGIKISPVPGVSALIAALSISGLPSDRFIFEGFLPPKGNKRIDRIKCILESDCTSILYESTHKIERLLEEMTALEPERRIVIARELTKTYEEILRGSVKELLEVSKRPGGLKGEIVVLIAAKEKEKIKNSPNKR